MEIEVRALRKKDRRKEFSCGQPELDNYFHRFAGQGQFRQHVGVTYVAVAGEKLCGFATVAAGSIEFDELPQAFAKGLPSYPLPILRLGRLGISVEHQGQGIGKLLMRWVFLLALEQKNKFGCIGIVVDAKEGAVGFYERYGFQALVDVVEGKLRTSGAGTMPMFLAINSVQTPGKAQK